VKRALGIYLAALLLLPACQPKEPDLDIEAEIARNLKEGDSNLRNNKVAEAQTNYEVVLGYDANNAAALTGLGRIALDGGKFAEAVEPLEKAVAADAQHILAQASLGRAHAGLKDWPKAVEHLGKAWELDKDTEQYGLEYGVALRESKQLDKAAEVLEEVAEINPKIKYVYRELGKVQFEANELDKALRTFMKAQTQWAGDQDSFAGAAMVYEAQGEISKSVDQWSQYIQQDCCSTYSKDVAQPKLAELKAKENALPNEPAPSEEAPTEG
jgi:tetratricopeptide (TPR) repeat protein